MYLLVTYIRNGKYMGLLMFGDKMELLLYIKKPSLVD